MRKIKKIKLTKKEINLLIKYQEHIQNKLILLREHAFLYYEPTFFGFRKRSSLTYENGLETAQRVVSNILELYFK